MRDQVTSKNFPAAWPAVRNREPIVFSLVVIDFVLLLAARLRTWVFLSRWELARLAIDSIPAARTESNDFLHIAMILVTTLALVRLASLRD